MTSSPSHPEKLVDHALEPLRWFARSEIAGGVALLMAALAALAWANSPWSSSYHSLWETSLSVSWGDRILRLTLHQVINDGLMAIFFFVVGLEIKREMLAGELSSPRGAALPVLAALGGMVVPAALYAVLAWGTPAARGWGVPMATDIAFAVGVLVLLGDRVPSGLRIMLSALAIADDLGAILVIALFYSHGIAWGALAVGAGILCLAAAANVAGVRSAGAYAILGVLLWLAVLSSGIHSTVAGVLLAMVIPVRTRLDETGFARAARSALHKFEVAAARTAADPATTTLSNEEHHHALLELEDLCEQAQPPLVRLEAALHGPVFLAIMPLFALANAGVALSFTELGSSLGSPVVPAVALGLLVGKPLGIAGASWLAVRTGVAVLPSHVTWRMILGVGLLGGIGFTMSLFIGTLAFGAGPLLDAAKIAVLGASVCSGVAGWLVLRGATRST